MLEPVKEGGFEDAAAAEEGVAGEPDQLGFAEAEPPRGFKLLAQVFHFDNFTQANGGSAIDEGERGARLPEMLPDELEHEELVEVGVEQGAGDGVHLPVVIVRAPDKIDHHVDPTLLELRGRQEAG